MKPYWQKKKMNCIRDNFCYVYMFKIYSKATICEHRNKKCWFLWRHTKRDVYSSNATFNIVSYYWWICTCVWKIKTPFWEALAKGSSSKGSSRREIQQDSEELLYITFYYISRKDFTFESPQTPKMQQFLPERWKSENVASLLNYMHFYIKWEFF